MRTEGQIRQKLKQVLYRSLQKAIRGIFRPDECKYNKKGNFQGRPVGVCKHKNCGMHQIICDYDPIYGNSQQVSECPWFEAKKSKEVLKAEFKELIKSTDDRGKLALNYPDAAALLWVLGEVDGDELISILNEEIESEKKNTDEKEV